MWFYTDGKKCGGGQGGLYGATILKAPLSVKKISGLTTVLV